MIQIDFPSPDGCQLKIIVKGHSGLGNVGSDVVCAAVSALLQTFVAGVETEVNGTVFGTYEPGNCDLLVEVPLINQETFTKICNIFRFGFQKIAESHPDHVNLKIT